MPSSLGFQQSKADQNLVVSAVNREASKIVVAEYSSMAPVLGRCRSEINAVLVHDVFAFRTESFREAGLPPDHADVPLETELSWLENADLCLYASTSEARRLASLLPEKRHIWLPPRMHLTPISAPTSNTPRAVFLGVRHGGNLDALNLILESIWPRVREALPDAELWVVGEVGEGLKPHPPGVRVLGRVDELSAISGPDFIGLAPDRAASGASIKIFTYIALGMCVVATSKAIEGYNGKLEEFIETEDDPEKFAEKVVAVMSNAELRCKNSCTARAALMRLQSAEFGCFLAKAMAAAPSQPDKLIV